MRHDPILDVLYRVKRGLAGYVSYLAACDMNQSFSEYILYEPTLRILTAQGWAVECEYPCPGYQKQGSGDYKKIDFVASKQSTSFAIEMKWAKKQKINVASDIEKLLKYLQANNQARGFISVFGRRGHIEQLSLGGHNVKERGSPVYAEFGVTRYGCRNYEVTAG
jgi:hypothetical protein